MTDGWFNVPEIGDGSADSPYRPDYVDSIDGIDGYSGQRLTDASPRWIARVFGPQAALDDLASREGVSRASDSDVNQRLKSATGQNRSVSEWEQRFYVR